MSETALAIDEPAAAQDPFGIYVHWPFCLAKCPYCDFNSHVRHGASAGIDQQRYTRAYLRELAYFASLTPGRRVATVFFGGGTPSLMEPATVAGILEAIDEFWGFEEGPEITLEANPTSVEAERFRGYAAAGVNRLSLGIQALNDRDLKALGRQHSATEALHALEIAKANFGRVSFDLIYGRQGQSEADWEAELGEALGYAADHLSLYQLTIEAGTRFADLYAAGKLKMPSGERAEALYDITQDLCAAAGLPAYEISNHARAGFESRHNLIYWRAHDYAGIGPGAHSRLTLEAVRTAFSARRMPESWLQAVEMGTHGLEEPEQLTAAEAADEYLLMGLRLAEGIDLRRHGEMGGRIAPSKIGSLVAAGLVRCDGRRLAATRQGRMLLDRLILELAS